MTVTVPSPATLGAVARGRARRRRRRLLVVGGLAIAVAATYLLSLMVGQTFYTPAEVWGVITGQTVPGASFTVGELRLPRATVALLTGLCFGMGGAVFQTMLRNPLASPDIIGVNAGASAAAVVGIVFLSLDPTSVSFVATVGALVTAMAIYLLAYKDGGAGARFILIGIGVAAIFNSVVSYVLSRAAEWDLQAAMRWITGNLNGSSWEQAAPLALTMLVVVPVLLWLTRDLELMRLGDDAAAGLGVPVERRRILLIVAAVALLAFATAAAGPISFVAFLSGPIAARLLGPVGSPVLAAGLFGSLLVLVADLVAQYLLGLRLPVGVVTGVLGAPYLILLLIRSSRSGGSL
ncbi:FecCD family ABC transporter permease [Microbacterium radiodurans]|uniref:Iron chelate uptake ABC transporter family permease subunit n=1 Tax=Microbacterium radiodurans TaxID=661398 RepID=A0A5J5ISS0_9MICO|nr:iron chelate uptake ABC transporter family permease subunit [Microbacterium radiodurans]KAA9087111.1 iron chelate uptake ABC transporter family permease subunit [Microbacterium radiodurans]